MQKLVAKITAATGIDKKIKEAQKWTKNMDMDGSLSKKELRAKKREIELELRQAEHEFKELKVNHILHLLLSLVTAGIWLVVWIIITINTTNKQNLVTIKLYSANSALISVEKFLDDLN